MLLSQRLLYPEVAEIVESRAPNQGRFTEQFVRGVQVWHIKCSCNTTDVTSPVPRLWDETANATFEVNFDSGAIMRRPSNALTYSDHPFYTYGFDYARDQYDPAEDSEPPEGWDVAEDGEWDDEAMDMYLREGEAETPKLWYSIACKS